jgi:hypothetical protein
VIEASDWGTPTSEIEAMVQAAGTYVVASRDLRPRVLETARAECRERRAQRSIRRVALVVALFAAFTAPSGGSEDTRCPALLAALDSDHIFSQAESKVARGGDLSWSMVEAFTDLRRQQANALRLEL